MRLSNSLELAGPRSDLEVPGRLGRYLLLTRIARGGMANVFVGEPEGQEFTDHFVAVKVLLRHLAKKKKFVDMFRSEGKLGLLLQHPNIARTLEVGRKGQLHFIAMDFVDGQDLGRILRFFRKARAPVPLPMALYVVREVLQALHYAHTLRDSSGQLLQLVNRDISPANVMIAYDGSVRLIDFGIAQATLHYRSQIGSIKGKIPYMSPEQVRGLAVDARSDLFSLGTILYQMLTCLEPFRAVTEFEQMERVREANPTPLCEVNRRVEPQLAEIIQKALAKEPGQRHQTAAAMLEAIDDYLGKDGLLSTQSDIGRFMLDEFADERALFIGQIEAARDVLRKPPIEPCDTDPTAPSPRRTRLPPGSGNNLGSTRRRRWHTAGNPKWLLPAVIVLVTLAVLLLLVAILR